MSVNYRWMTATVQKQAVCYVHPAVRRAKSHQMIWELEDV
jgi:hypothetical protein